MPRINFRDLYNRASLPQLSPGERERISIMIIEADTTSRNSLKQALTGLGYLNLCDAPNHLLALKKFEERKISHVIFDAKKTNMPTKEFLQKLFEMDPNIIAIALSSEPSVDDVFDLLIIGARGYIVKPYNADALDSAIIMATKGEPISEAILHAKNRNEALASLVMTTFGKLATIMRQAEQFETAQREVPRKMLAFKRAMDIARTFADGGDSIFVESIVEFCCDRGSGPASRLGRIRKRLGAKKSSRDSKKGNPELPTSDVGT